MGKFNLFHILIIIWIHAVFMLYLWMNCHFVSRSDWETLNIFLLFQSSLRKDLSSHVKVMMKRLITIRWSARYKAIRAVKILDFQKWFINLSFRNSSNEKWCINNFDFNWIFLHVSFCLLLRGNSGTNISHLNEISRTWFILDVFLTYMDATKMSNRNSDRLVSESDNLTTTKDD